ncbi:MAG: hypothetical protein WC917_00770 [Bacilli bacterium]|jgi:hypothetical protein
MQKFLTDPARLGRGYPVIGYLSVEFSHGDAVYIDSSGWLALATAGGRILGYYCGQGETMSATNTTVAKVCPDYVYAHAVEMVYGADQDCTQTDVGAYCDFGTVTTGAFELNLAASTSGQVIVLGFDPEGTGDNDAVVVMASEPQYLAFAQA